MGDGCALSRIMYGVVHTGADRHVGLCGVTRSHIKWQTPRVFHNRTAVETRFGVKRQTAGVGISARDENGSEAFDDMNTRLRRD
jgi:hypothetical protein